jgi:N-acetylmuramoyl-L-alanine amidase
MKLAIGLFAMALLTWALFTMQIQDDEHPQISASSQQFAQSAQSSFEKLRSAGFANGLETPALGALPSKEFELLVSAIQSEAPISGVGIGTRGIKYDVILQSGHYGRPPGPVGTSGHLVSERALVAYITNVTADELRREGNSVLVLSADHYLRPTPGHAGFDGLKAKVFIAIHADGSVKPCSTGPSLGYQSNSSLLAMHAVGWSLASALGYRYSDFNHDNFTANEAQYYMFRQVQADRLTGLLEVGELTCPNSERDLISSSKLVGRNIARALTFIVQTPTE